MQPARIDPPQAFELLGILAGQWEAKIANGAAIRVSFRLVANNSVLVQSFIMPGGDETLTLFHRDGARLIATHYCAQGNQPRLQLAPSSTAENLDFKFVDATNLTQRSLTHLIRLEFSLEGPDQYTEIETYDDAGRPDVTILNFRRAK